MYRVVKTKLCNPNRHAPVGYMRKLCGSLNDVFRDLELYLTWYKHEAQCNCDAEVRETQC